MTPTDELPMAVEIGEDHADIRAAVRKGRRYGIAPISSKPILACPGEHGPGLPRSC